jgi:hypothetical protein
VPSRKTNQEMHGRKTALSAHHRHALRHNNPTEDNTNESVC